MTTRLLELELMLQRLHREIEILGTINESIDRLLREMKQDVNADEHLLNMRAGRPQ